jgi:prepilin-type N-terminal cleavage/methylation domain-containing protein
MLAMNSLKSNRGFSLAEMMVALVAGLLVSGAALAFLMSTMRSNGEYVQSVRLTEELRNSLDLASRDLRRAGYDDDALRYMSTGTFSPLSKIQLVNGGAANSCIIYAYDRAAGTKGQVDTAAGEVRGLRRVTATVNGIANVGIIEYAESTGTTKPDCGDASATYTSYPPACNGVWCALSDPATLNVTAFTVTDQSPATIVSGSQQMKIRNYLVTVTGQLVGSTDVTRGVSTRVRVRADCINPTISNCNAKP